MQHNQYQHQQQGGEPALPEGAARYAVTLDGTESDAELAKLKALKPIMVLINVDAKCVHTCIYYYGGLA